MPRSSASKKSVEAGERDRPDVARRREQWKKYQDRIDATRLVFIDETWTRTDMAPLRGWSPRGSRLIAKVPHGRWKTMTCLAALRHDRIDAPWFIEGPINGESFRAYVEYVLLPTLHPGDIVILDNLGSHKSKAVRQLIRSVGARIFFFEILARPEPNRTGFCEAQAPSTEGLGANRRHGVRRHCCCPRRLLRRRMCQLPQKLGLSNLISSRFRRDPGGADHPGLAAGVLR